jgi:hypothetical protein
MKKKPIAEPITEQPIVGSSGQGDGVSGVSAAASAAGVHGRARDPRAVGVAGEHEATENIGRLGTPSAGVEGDTGGQAITLPPVIAGVRGSAHTPSSVGVLATSVKGGTALEIDGGAIRVSGTGAPAFSVGITGEVSGIGTPMSADRVMWQLTCRSSSEIDHPLSNGDASALLFVTPLSTFDEVSIAIVPKPNDKGHWVIQVTGHAQHTAPRDIVDFCKADFANTTLNVLVIKR